MLNELPTTTVDGGLLAELGSFYSGETRKLVLTFTVPGIAALGLAQIATLDLTHVSLPDLVQHTTSLPVHVNVVPGDQAAGRIADPVVRAEALYQRAQHAKRRSGELLGEGRTHEAIRLLGTSSSALRAQASVLPLKYRRTDPGSAADDRLGGRDPRRFRLPRRQELLLRRQPQEPQPRAPGHR